MPLLAHRTPRPARAASSAIALLVSLASLAGCRAGPGPSPPPAPRPVPAAAAAGADDPVIARGILRRDGERIVDGTGQPVRWRGVAFGNQVWSGRALPVGHHDEADLARVRGIGMNAVRFYLHYATLEDDAAPGVYKESGWRWLDQNVAWARRHGVYLILNLHVPPGGYQSNGGGGALWDSPALQDRLVRLWRAIAARYAAEAIVGGYDVLNEPCVPRSRAQWQALATRLTRAIREVDPRHIVIIERVNAVAREWKNDADMNFVTVDDPNVVYTFHFYDPLTYTHQFAPWVQMGEGGRWPDDDKIGRSEYADWPTAVTAETARLPAGDSPWTRLDTKPIAAADPAATVGRISLVGSRVGNGRVLFDEIAVTEHGERDIHLRDVLRIDLVNLRGWQFRSTNGSGRLGLAGDGHETPGALTVAGTTDDADLGSAQQEFRLRPGRSYRLTAWARGERLPADAVAQARLDFVRPDGPIMGWNKAFLAQMIDRYTAWGHRHGVPIFLGEFGVHRPCFQDGRGGLAWVQDVLEIAEARDLPYTYHDYHGDSFGLFLGGGRVDPARANDELIGLFTRTISRR